MPVPSVQTVKAPDITLRQTVRSLMIVFCLIYCATAGLFSFAYSGANTALGAAGGLGAGEEDSTVTTFVHRLVCVLLIYLIYPHWRKIAHTFSKLKLISLLTLLPVVSVLWSQNRATTAKESIYYIFTMLFAVYLAECVPPERLMRGFWYAGALTSSASAVLALALPKYGIDAQTGRGGEWEGIFLGKNNCAAAMFFLLIPTLHAKVDGRLAKWVKYLSILMILGVMVMTKSKTNLLISVSFFGFLAALKVLGRFHRKDVTVILPVLVTIAGTAAVIIVSNLGSVLESVGRDSTFSGRSEIWKAVIISILKHPMLGYGYRAFWQGMTGESANVIAAVGWLFGYAHDGFLEVMLQVGVVGLFVWVLSLIKALKDAFTCYYPGRPAYIDGYISVVVYSVLYNISEASIMTRFSLLWIMYLVSCISLHYAARERKQMLAMQSQAPKTALEPAMA